MNEDVKKIYDYVCDMEKDNSESADKATENQMRYYFNGLFTASWAIKHFIEVNFK